MPFPVSCLVCKCVISYSKNFNKDVGFSSDFERYMEKECQVKKYVNTSSSPAGKSYGRESNCEWINVLSLLCVHQNEVYHLLLQNVCIT